MFGKLRLFRGDASKIQQFHLAQTDRNCLLGQGIYLTDREMVADTYRVKGDYESYRPLRDTFRAKDRTHARLLGLKKFLSHKRYYNEPRLKDLTERQIEQFTKEYYDNLDKGVLIIERGHRQLNPGLFHGAWDFTLSEVGGKSGWVSVFEFPEPFFTRNVINFDATRKDKGFLEILDDVKFWKDKGTTIKSTTGGLTGYLGYTNDRRGGVNDFVSLDPRAINFGKLIPVLKEFGIHGFEYNGGARLGGGFYHRAFNIFDQDYVNDHKVDRYR